MCILFDKGGWNINICSDLKPYKNIQSFMNVRLVTRRNIYTLKYR